LSVIGSKLNVVGRVDLIVLVVVENLLNGINEDEVAVVVVVLVEVFLGVVCFLVVLFPAVTANLTVVVDLGIVAIFPNLS
jgi:hypothetical protein